MQKQSKLIESVVMRIPLPVFYLAEDEEGRMIVVDGLQRLSTFHRFLKDGHRLQLPDTARVARKDDSMILAPKLQNRSRGLQPYSVHHRLKRARPGPAGHLRPCKQR